MKDEKVVDVDFRSKKQKVSDFFGKVGNGIRTGAEWVVTHPVEMSIGVGLTIGVLRETRLMTNKFIQIHDAAVKDRTIYCNDIQQNVELKHKLNTFEAIELRDRMDKGQTKLRALIEMGLVKK